MNLLNLLLKTMLTDSSLSALAKKTGLSSKQLKKLIPLAIPLLLKFMTSNASTQSGAQSLLGALTQHTNTKAMDEQFGEADMEDGGKIVAHILGSNSDKAVQSLALESGMSAEDVNRALGGLAPALLSGLSAATGSAAKVDLSDGLDLSDLMAMFGGAQAQAQPQQSGGMGLLGSLLGGGNSTASAQANPLGGLFGSLLGSGAQAVTENDSSVNGMALLSALTALMK